MTVRDYVIDEMISAKSIAARVEALAREISQHFAGSDQLIVVGLLRGSFVFIADLVRELRLPVEVDFLEVSSYGSGMQSSREVRIVKDLVGKVSGLEYAIAGSWDGYGPDAKFRLGFRSEPFAQCGETGQVTEKAGGFTLDRAEVELDA